MRVVSSREDYDKVRRRFIVGLVYYGDDNLPMPKKRILLCKRLGYADGYSFGFQAEIPLSPSQEDPFPVRRVVRELENDLLLEFGFDIAYV